jgi:hypothetical protein
MYTLKIPSSFPREWCAQIDQRPRHPACATAKRIDGRENSDTWEDMDPTHPQEEWIQP